MNNLICLIICFLTGVLIYQLIKSYCGCNRVIEGQGCNDHSNDEQQCKDKVDCTWLFGRCISVDEEIDRFEASTKSIVLVNFFYEKQDNTGYGLVKYIIEKSKRLIDPIKLPNLNSLKTIVDIRDNASFTKYNNIIENANLTASSISRSSSSDNIFDVLEPLHGMSTHIDIIKTLYYFIFVYKSYNRDDDDVDFFPDIIPYENIYINVVEYDNCKKQIKNIILDPRIIPLINSYYSQMALTTDNFSPERLNSNQRNEFFIIYVLIDTIYIIFHKYYNTLNNAIITHLNNINENYNTLHDERLNNLVSEEDRVLFDNMFGRNIDSTTRDLTTIAFNPVIAINPEVSQMRSNMFPNQIEPETPIGTPIRVVGSDAPELMTQMFSQNPAALLPTNINESVLITSGDDFRHLKTISKNIDSLDDENIRIIRSVPELENQTRQAEMFTSLRQPLHNVSTSSDNTPQIMSMQGCPIIPLRLNH